MEYLSALNINTIFDLLGTFAFAVSGIRLASDKRFDLFGAYVVGLITAIGGGTVRDTLLGVSPFWMHDPSYLIVTGVALLATVVFKSGLFSWGRTLFLFDSIGLGLFTVVGIEKSLAAGYPFWVCIIMGAVTGSVGGVIRDVLINEIPLLFRKDIYALASIAGGLVYFGCLQMEVSASATILLAASTVLIIRIVAVKMNIHLPFFNFGDTPKNQDQRP